MKHVLIRTAVAGVIATGGVGAFAILSSAPAFAYSSSACWDGVVPPGSAETGAIGTGALGFSADVGAQGVNDYSVPSENWYLDTCYQTETPVLYVPFYGSFGGEITGGYTSYRDYNTGPCIIHQNDPNSQYNPVANSDNC